MLNAFHDGPWFILNHFLSIRQWERKFLASTTKLTHSALWVCLPELPTEFYDLDILHKMGSKIGKLLKIDTYTSGTTRGQYARICVEVPLEKPLRTHIYIGTHKQVILYEGIHLCTACDKIGHLLRNCSTTITLPNTLSTLTTNQNSTVAPTESQE